MQSERSIVEVLGTELTGSDDRLVHRGAVRSAAAIGAGALLLALTFSVARPVDTGKPVDEAAGTRPQASQDGVAVAPLNDQLRSPDSGLAKPKFECPVTEPNGFVPPPPWNGMQASDGTAWHGTTDLWTLVSVDEYVPRKSLWWTSTFTDGTTQPTPQVTVRYERLDIDDEPVIQPAPANNAFTPEYGWLIINGREPDEPGCWRATGTYKEVSLSYVFLSPP